MQILQDPARRSNQGNALRWIGGGLYLCGQCGESDVKSDYIKRDRVNRCRATGHCKRTANKVDTYVRATVAARLRRPDIAELLAHQDGKERATELRTEAAGLRQRLDGLGVDYAEGLLTAGQVRAATERLESRLTEINAELGSLGRSDQLATSTLPGMVGSLVVQRRIRWRRVRRRFSMLSPAIWGGPRGGLVAAGSVRLCAVWCRGLMLPIRRVPRGGG